MKKPFYVGITGHQKLHDESSWPKVHAVLLAILGVQSKPIIGLTSLAIGADQMFAEVLLDIGQSFEAIIPFDGYDKKFKPRDRVKYHKLLASAISFETLPGGVADEVAYFDAGKMIVRRSNLMIAVWDGEPAGGLGGTADVVDYAKSNNTAVEIIDPNHL